MWVNHELLGLSPGQCCHELPDAGCRSDRDQGIPTVVIGGYEVGRELLRMRVLLGPIFSISYSFLEKRPRIICWSLYLWDWWPCQVTKIWPSLSGILYFCFLCCLFSHWIYCKPIKFSLNNFHWIQWIVTNSEIGMIARDTPSLATGTFRGEVVEIKSVLLPLGRYLFSVVIGK